MTDLTEDETTVLLIAAEGQPMMAIGRWAPSVASLVKRGYLTSGDKFNAWITEAGKVAAANYSQKEDETFREVLMFGSKLATVHQKARQSAEQAAQHLAIAVRASLALTGGTDLVVVSNWANEVAKRALEIVRGGK